MTERICDEPACDNPLPARRHKYCSRPCQRAGERRRYNAKRVPMTCAYCKQEFMGRRWAKDPGHQRRYCSTTCDANAKRERYGIGCEHMPAQANECPSCTFLERIQKPTTRQAWRTVLRADPCAYCGQQPSNGLDHIDAAERHSDRSDITNWTGCCKRCNELKQSLPLLLALPWVPLAREYHDMRRLCFTR